MVKFQKQMAGQLVPEWKEAYCNYKQLKRQVKCIKAHYELVNASLSNENISINSLDLWTSRGSPFTSFAGLSGKRVNSPRILWTNVEHVVVHLRKPGTAGAEPEFQDEFYETEVLSALIPVQLAKDFFKVLDSQLNKVNRFYKLKEEEYNLRAHSLRLQMAALLDLRRALGMTSSSINCKVVAAFAVEKDFIRSESTGHDSSMWERRYIPDMSLSKNQLQSAEKGMRTAFIEFYRGLGNLKSFSALNMMAFAKIMKKYDKVTGWNASLAYCRVVESSNFAASDKVLQLMDGVEDIFTQHLAQQNYRQAMVYLKPVQGPSQCGAVSYLQGLFTGCSVALFATLALTLVLPSKRFLPVGHPDITFQDLLPISSTIGLVLLHLYLYAWNMYLWRRARINYPFLLEWTPRTEQLGCPEMLLLSTCFATFWLLILVILRLYPDVPHGDLLPLTFLLVFLIILFLPLNICYKSARLVFLRSVLRIVSAPFHKVVLADFFLADQLCSQVTTIKNIQYLSCYYFQGYFHSQEAEPCTEGNIYQSFQYILCMLPYWWRMLQCARRWIDEKDIKQAINGGKYLSALFASLLKVAYMQQEGTPGVWFSLFVVSAAVSTVYNLYWDIVMDWGLMQSPSMKLWLRAQLIIKHKCIYYLSMVLNSVLRLAWLLALIHVPEGVNSEVTDVILAMLEVFRRCHWNFYRLEYEHLSNFGKSKSVIHRPFEDLEHLSLRVQ